MALPDNQHALSSSGGCTVQLFNVNDGAILRTFMLDRIRYVGCLALQPDGRRFVAGCGCTARIVEHGLVL